MSKSTPSKASLAAACTLGAALAVDAANFQAVSKGEIPDFAGGRAVWADFDGDGYLDAAIMGQVAGTAAWRTAVFKYDPVGKTYVRFTGADLPVLQTSGSLAWSDMDIDGAPDLLVTGPAGGNTSAPQTNVYQNDGSHFGPLDNDYVGLPAVQGPGLMADFNNDGRPDVLLLGGTGYNDLGARIFEGVGDASFFEATGTGLTPVGAAPMAAIGDFNNDGIPDVVLSGRINSAGDLALEVFQGLGNFKFGAPVILTYSTGLGGLRIGAITLVDYNGDGRLDILATGKTKAGGAKTLLYKNTDNKFHFSLIPNTSTSTTTQVTGLEDVYYSATDAGDFNNDGKPDLIVTGYSPRLAKVVSKLYVNNGGSANPIFTEVDAGGIAAVEAGFATFGDYDHDGHLDLLVGGITSNTNTTAGKTVLYRNINTTSKAVANKPTGLKIYANTTDGVTSSITGKWASGSAAPTPTVGLSYNVHFDDINFSPSTIILDGNANTSTGLRKFSGLGNNFLAKVISLSNVYPNNKVRLRVQTVDANDRGSLFATGDWRICNDLAGKLSTAAGAYNLTAFGTADWVHWGGSNDPSMPDEKSAPLPTVIIHRTLSAAGTPVMSAFPNPDVTLTWTDSKNISPSGSSNQVMMTSSDGMDFLIQAEADVNYRTFYVFFGGYDAEANLSIADPRWSNSSDGQSWLNESFSFPDKKVNYLYTVTYKRDPSATDFPRIQFDFRLNKKYHDNSYTYVSAAAVAPN